MKRGDWVEDRKSGRRYRVTQTREGFVHLRTVGGGRRKVKAANLGKSFKPLPDLLTRLRQEASGAKDYPVPASVAFPVEQAEESRRAPGPPKAKERASRPDAPPSAEPWWKDRWIRWAAIGLLVAVALIFVFWKAVW